MSKVFFHPASGLGIEYGWYPRVPLFLIPTVGLIPERGIGVHFLRFAIAITWYDMQLEIQSEIRHDTTVN